MHPHMQHHKVRPVKTAVLQKTLNTPFRTSRLLIGLWFLLIEILCAVLIGFDYLS